MHQKALQLKVDIAIVGNGILACAIAASLKDSGKKIALIGPKDRPDSASVAAAAMLNSFAELGEGALDHEMQQFKFLCSRRASDFWPQELKNLEAQTGLNLPLIEGTSLIKAGERSEPHFSMVHKKLTEFEKSHELLSDHKLHILDEGAVEPNLVFQAYDKICEQSETIEQLDGFVYKLELNEGKTIYTHNGDVIKADQIVLASGVNVGELCQKTPELNGVLQLFYGRGLAAHLELPDHGLDHTHRTCHDGAHCGVYLIPYNENRLYLGATSELLEERTESNKRVELNYLIDRASQHILPNIKDAQIVKVLSGYRPTTADAFPIIGETQQQGVWVVSGTKRDGFHMVPVIAREMTKALIESCQPFENKFNPERKIYQVYSIDRMLSKAVHYFGTDLSSIEERWQKIKQHYPQLQSGIDVELWPLFENQWVNSTYL